MTWVAEAREHLKQGRHARVRPQGGSMRGRIESEQLVTIAPATIADVQPDDVVFVEWKGNFLLHLAKEVEADRVLISNTLGKINGWVAASAILGKVIAVGE